MPPSLPLSGNAGPLAGIRLIDMTSLGMGPLAAQILGDYGADVIKVEPPRGMCSGMWCRNDLRA
jgi:crotonobetainyl-CoA:carnitine CoA-transferase CaiB-like acyl-CoA transferase